MYNLAKGQRAIAAFSAKDHERFASIHGSLAMDNDRQVIDVFNMTRVMSNGLVIGPILMGVAKPAHILTPQATVRCVVNMSAVACVEAQIRAGARGEE